MSKAIIDTWPIYHSLMLFSSRIEPNRKACDIAFRCAMNNTKPIEVKL